MVLSKEGSFWTSTPGNSLNGIMEIEWSEQMAGLSDMERVVESRAVESGFQDRP
jgi:hypothetical protein